jgi:hypothetical protein
LRELFSFFASLRLRVSYFLSQKTISRKGAKAQRKLKRRRKENLKVRVADRRFEISSR